MRSNLLGLLLFFGLLPAANSYCWPENKNASLSWTGNTSENRTYVIQECVGTRVLLSCCAEGYATRAWYKDVNGNAIDLTSDVGNGGRYTSEGNGIEKLVINSLEVEDRGIYYCVVTDSAGRSLSKKFEVMVDSLEHKNCCKRPEVRLNVGGDVVIETEIGRSLTLTCNALLTLTSKNNCNETLKFVWLKSDGVLENGVSEKFKWWGRVDKVVTNPETQLAYSSRRTLELDNATKFGVYKCQLIGTNGIAQSYVVRLKEPGVNLAILLPCVFVGLIILTVLCILFYLFGWVEVKIQILQFYVRYFEKYEKTGEYDLFVFSSENLADSQLAVALGRYIERYKNRRVFIYERDSIVGAYKSDNYIRAVQESCCVLVVISESFVNDQLCCTALEKARKDQKRVTVCVNETEASAENLTFPPQFPELQVYYESCKKFRWNKSFDQLIGFKMKPLQSYDDLNYRVNNNTDQNQRVDEFESDDSDEKKSSRIRKFFDKIKKQKQSQSFKMFISDLVLYLPTDESSDHEDRGSSKRGSSVVGSSSVQVSIVSDGPEPIPMEKCVEKLTIT